MPVMPTYIGLRLKRYGPSRIRIDDGSHGSGLRPDLRKPPAAHRISASPPPMSSPPATTRTINPAFDASEHETDEHQRRRKANVGAAVLAAWRPRRFLDHRAMVLLQVTPTSHIEV